MTHLVVGDDAVVDDDELVGLVRPVRMRVDGRWNAVSGPARVRDAQVCRRHSFHLKGRFHWQSIHHKFRNLSNRVDEFLRLSTQSTISEIKILCPTYVW